MILGARRKLASASETQMHWTQLLELAEQEPGGMAPEEGNLSNSVKHKVVERWFKERAK